MNDSQGYRSVPRHQLHRLLAMAAFAIVGILALGAVTAGAAVRYAAPGATGHSPCPRVNPCSLFVAASLEDVQPSEMAKPGDEVVALPGEYSGAAGDLGPQEYLSLRVDVDLHGEAGSPPPVIRSNRRGTVLAVNGFSTVSDLEIIAPNSWFPLWVGQSTAQRLIVRTAAEHGIACQLAFQAILRDSACISSGPKGIGAGVRVHTTPHPLNTRTLRNVTAIASGPESTGILFQISGAEVSVFVKSTIARGMATDVEAIGSGSDGGSFIFLENSAYSTSKAVEVSGGLAFVTTPGENGNITATPLLAADDIHQLPGSPTIDQGVVDADSGVSDVDGGARVVGGHPDIGADEWVFPTTTDAACNPSSLHFGQAATCTAVVESTDPTAVEGTVAFAIEAGGGRTELGTCQPMASEPGLASCSLSFPVQRAGSPLVTAAFSGDPSHGSSIGSAGLAVAQNQTSTALDCDSTTLLVDAATNCSVTVTDTVVTQATPTGVVQVASSGPGRMLGAPSCALLPSSTGRASCQITYTPTALGSGIHEIAATYAGDEGHEASSSSRLGLAVSSRPVSTRPDSSRSGSETSLAKPNTRLKRRPARRTKKHRAAFAFGSGQANSQFKCKLDKKPYRSCRSPFSATVSTGRHVFKVRALGPGGADPTPAVFRWVVLQ